MIDFLYSNLFQTLVTLFVGCFVLYLYRKQQVDHKKAAATALYLEIQNIEECLPQVRDALNRNSLNDLDINLVRTNEWLKNSYLFSGNLDNDEWQSVSNFYHHAQLIDEAIRQSSRSFVDDIANIRRNKQKFFAILAKEALEGDNRDRTAKEVLGSLKIAQDIFDKFYMSNQNDLSYTPVKYQNDAERSLLEMHKISITTIGSKLKRLKSKGHLRELFIYRRSNF